MMPVCKDLVGAWQPVVPTVLTLVTCMMEPVPTVFVDSE